MRYLILTITAFVIISSLSHSAEAQILNRLKKKAQQAAAQKAEEKMTEQIQKAAEQMVEKSWNSIFGEIHADSTGKLPFIMNSNVTTEKEYQFDTITTMEIQTTKKNGETEPPLIMDMHFNTNKMYTGTAFSSEEMKKEDGDLFIIYDFNNSAMLMLMSNDNNKFSFAYDWKQALATMNDSLEAHQREAENWDETDKWQGYTKIGHKTILGYNCDGYQSQSENEEVEIWVTGEAEYGMNSLFQAQTNARQIKGIVPENYPYGMMLELTSKDLGSGETTTMKVTDINKNADVRYVMADYPTMSLGTKAPKN